MTMKTWAAMVTVAVLGSAVLGGSRAEAFQPYFPGEKSPEMVELRARLAERADQFEQLEQEAAFYAEAEALGITTSVQASQLPPRQQRRLAVAIVREARANSLDPLLVVAVIHCESTFNNYAVSGVGAMGLMQVMPDTGSYLADKAGYKLQRHSNLFDSETNIELGTAYLANLISRFGTPERALVAYNAGPTQARKILSQDDSRDRFLAGYPAKVMREFRQLKAQRSRDLARRDSAPTGPANGPG